MRRRDFLAFVGASAAAWPLAARAQNVPLARGMKRLGLIFTLAQDDPSLPQYLTPYFANLAAQGWVEGKNLQVDYRWGINTTHSAAVNRVAQEIVDMKPAVIQVAGTQNIVAVQSATKTIPIVFSTAIQPLETGLVDSLAHPGGNSTGFTNVDFSFSANELGMLMELAPTTKRAAMLLDPGNTVINPFYVGTWQAAAKTAGVEPVFLYAHTGEEIAPAIGQFALQPNSGFHVGINALYLANRGVLLSEIDRDRMPAVWGHILYGQDGRLVSYGIDAPSEYGRCGEYVGLLLNGAKVRDLPVRYPTTYKLVVNLKTAQRQGFAVPNTILARADQVIQ